jgi:hypothetical protein
MTTIVVPPRRRAWIANSPPTRRARSSTPVGGEDSATLGDVAGTLMVGVVGVVGVVGGLAGRSAADVPTRFERDGVVAGAAHAETAMMRTATRIQSLFIGDRQLCDEHEKCRGDQRQPSIAAPSRGDGMWARIR